jgi:hypothetical protein
MSDIVIVNPTTNINPANLSKKPSYLIVMEPQKTNSKIVGPTVYFLTLDKPEFVSNFIQAKGMFSDSSEENICKNYVDMLTTASKDLILEVLIPSHRILYMRSLLYKQK